MRQVRCLAAMLACGLVAAAAAPHVDIDAQRAEYRAQAAKTVLQLQVSRYRSNVLSRDASGHPMRVELIDVNPAVGAWFVLTFQRESSGGRAYHLENPFPSRQRVELRQSPPALQVIPLGSAPAICTLPLPEAEAALERARATGLAYAPLCDDRLFLRNAVRGTYTQIERTTDFLRDHVWGGEQIVSLVRDRLFADAYVQSAEVKAGPAATPVAAPGDAPRPAALAPAYTEGNVSPDGLGIALEHASGVVRLGAWYAVRDQPGIFVSAMQPRAISGELLAADRGRVNALDAVEAAALDYLVAFDLDRFELGFALGTDHPRVAWSARVLDGQRDGRLEGPDGIGTIAPLVANGMVSPAAARRAVAAFTGGFKREHGAFRYGELAHLNHGSHYGFIEQGAVLSKLQPGLATLLVFDDGRVDMKTWTRADDDALLPRIRHARQNGVAVLERDASGDTGVPGALLTQWGAGNWAGSKDQRLRTLRAGACLQQHGERRFLIYGYLSTGTPSAMARVFQAYHCGYAMHLDMNALEHTYLAIYTHRRQQLVVQHLIDGMAVVDRKGGDTLAARFIGFPDDRDFFYLLRRES